MPKRRDPRLPAWLMVVPALLFSVILLGGCTSRTATGESANDHGHDHDHAEEMTAQVTVWTDRYEIFMEHTPVVAGQPAEFVTHVTDRVTLEPRAEGEVTFHFQSEFEAVIDHVAPQPVRPGIYLPEIMISQAGTWHLSLLISEGSIVRVVELPSLRVHADEHAAAHAPVPESPEGITYLKEQQWKLGTRTEAAVRRSFAETIRLPAVVTAPPERKVAVSSAVPGHLAARPGDLLPRLGTQVKAGELLALVRPVFSEFAARLAEAEAGVVRNQLAVERAELELTRTQRLAADQARSEKQLREAEFTLRSAHADFDAARRIAAAYRSAGGEFLKAGKGRQDGGQEGSSLPVLELRAPIDGVITEIGAGLGEYVSAEQSVFTILDPSEVQITGHLPESDLLLIDDHPAASFEIPGGPGSPISIPSASEERQPFIGPEIDARTRTAPIVYRVSNPDGRLRIGMAVRLHVETVHAEDAIVVPRSAVVDEDGRPVAFVQLAGETFEKRDLVLGGDDGRHVQVLSGIEEGEQIVTQGAYAVRLASVATSIPAHGHAH